MTELYIHRAHVSDLAKKKYNLGAGLDDKTAGDWWLIEENSYNLYFDLNKYIYLIIFYSFSHYVLCISTYTHYINHVLYIFICFIYLYMFYKDVLYSVNIIICLLWYIVVIMYDEDNLHHRNLVHTSIHAHANNMKWRILLTIW